MENLFFVFDADKADCTITMKDEDFYKFGTGSLNPQTVSMLIDYLCAFMHRLFMRIL